MYVIDNFGQLCRTCASQKRNMINIFREIRDPDDVPIHIMLSSCSQLDVQQGDELPEHICYFCAKELEIAYKFQTRCRKSHEVFIKIVQEVCLDDLQLNTNETVMSDDETVVMEDDGGDGIEEYVEKNYGKIRAAENAKVYENITNTHEKEVPNEEVLANNDTEANYINYSDQIQFSLDNGTEEEDETELENCYAQDKDLAKVSMDSQTNIPSQIENSPQRTAACSLCEKTFFTKKALEFHQRIAHKNNLVNNKAAITTNIEIVQTFECKYCSEMFKHNNELQLHVKKNHVIEDDTSPIENQHITEKEFSCKICLKSFSSKSRFAHHMLYHSNNHYSCTIDDCKRTYSIKYKLIDHMRRFHGYYFKRKATTEF